VDQLAARAGLPVRTIREYQTTGLLPGPERRGRVGIYGPTHLARLALIGPETEGVRAGEPVEAIVLREEAVLGR